MSKYGAAVCPICEKPIADKAVWDEYQVRLDAASDGEDDPGLCEWESGFCWHDSYGGYDPDGSHDENVIKAKLILTLNQRDSLAEQLSASIGEDYLGKLRFAVESLSKMNAMYAKLVSESEVREAAYQAEIEARARAEQMVDALRSQLNAWGRHVAQGVV